MASTSIAQNLAFVNWTVLTGLALGSYGAVVLLRRRTSATSGFLGFTASLGADGPITVQYWNSREKLYDYASNPSSEHRPAWTAFNRRARKASGAVGIWHETYVVDKAESIYSGMPPTGLAKATATVPVGRKGDRARERLAYTPVG